MRLGLASMAVITLCLLGMGHAQPSQDSVATLRESVEATPAFHGLARYPQEIRYAILELSQDPKLLVRLNYLPDGADAARTELLATAPEDIRKAATILVEYPEVLDILSTHMELTTMVGVVYQKDEDALKARTDLGHAQILEQDEESVDAWSRQLTENPQALDEYLQAQEDYENDHDLTEDEEYDDDPDYGYEEDDEEYYFYGLPPYGYTRYALRYANRYPNLANCMVDHWQRGNNIGTFQNAGDDWWSRHKNVVNDDFLKNDAGRMGRLQENASFDQQLRHDLGPAASDATARQNYLAKHGDRYPNLKKHARPVKHPKKKPQAKKASKPRKKSTHEQKRKKVSRKKANTKQQTRRASKNMHRSHGGRSHHRPSRGGRRR